MNSDARLLSGPEGYWRVFVEHGLCRFLSRALQQVPFWRGTQGQSGHALQPPGSSCWSLPVLGSGEARDAAESHRAAAGPGPVCQPVRPLAHRQDAVCRLPGREGGLLPGEPRGPHLPRAPGNGVLTASGPTPRRPLLDSARLWISCVLVHPLGLMSKAGWGEGGERALQVLREPCPNEPGESVGRRWGGGLCLRM